jgi:hypothetical protein
MFLFRRYANAYRSNVLGLDDSIISVGALFRLLVSSRDSASPILVWRMSSEDVATAFLDIFEQGNSWGVAKVLSTSLRSESNAKNLFSYSATPFH